MAYDASKLTKLSALKALAEKVQRDYATKAAMADLAGKVEVLEQAGGQPNVLEGVKINGTALEIAEKMVDILIATGTANGTIKVNGADISIAGLAAMAYKANVSQADLDTALAAVLAAKADSATTLAGYGIGDAYTKDQVDAKISSVYKPAGSVAFADLPDAGEANLGNVYNVTNSFTTTDAFVEGSGKKHPAGTNVVVVSTGDGTYGYDVLAGFVDLSEYAKTADVVAKEDGKRLMTNAEGEKLGKVAEEATKVEASETNGNIKVNGIEQVVYTEPADVVHGAIATEAEVNEMLNEVFAPQA